MVFRKAAHAHTTEQVLSARGSKAVQYNGAAISLQMTACCGPRWLWSGSGCRWSGWRRRRSGATPLCIAAGIASTQALILGQASWCRVAAATITIVITGVATGRASERSVLRSARGFGSWWWARWLATWAPLRVTSRIAVAHALIFTQTAWGRVTFATVAVIIAIVTTSCANKRPITAVCSSLCNK